MSLDLLTVGMICVSILFMPITALIIGSQDRADVGRLTACLLGILAVMLLASCLPLLPGRGDDLEGSLALVVFFASQIVAAVFGYHFVHARPADRPVETIGKKGNSIPWDQEDV